MDKISGGPKFQEGEGKVKKTSPFFTFEEDKILH